MFDIIIPIYKVKPTYLEKCLENISPEKQWYKGEYRVIVIDATPLDWEYYDELMGLFDTYTFAEYYRQSGEGVSQARNQGVELSNNPYLCFVDGDDYWYEGHLFELVQAIEDSNERVVMWWTAMDMEIPSLAYPDTINTYTINHYPVHKWHEDLHYYYLTRYVVCTSTVCLKRDRFEELKGFNESIGIGEDVDMWCRMVGKPNTVQVPYQSFQHNVISAFKRIHEDCTTGGGGQSGFYDNNEPEFKAQQLEYYSSLHIVPTMEDKPDYISEEVWKEIVDHYIVIL